MTTMYGVSILYFSQVFVGYILFFLSGPFNDITRKKALFWVLCVIFPRVSQTECYFSKASLEFFPIFLASHRLRSLVLTARVLYGFVPIVVVLLYSSDVDVCMAGMEFSNLFNDIPFVSTWHARQNQRIFFCDWSGCGKLFIVSTMHRPIFIVFVGVLVPMQHFFLN